MAMFGRSFTPAMHAAIMGQLPGVMVEDDPYLTAQALDAPVPASGEFGEQPQHLDVPADSSPVGSEAGPFRGMDAIKEAVFQNAMMAPPNSGPIFAPQGSAAPADAAQEVSRPPQPMWSDAGATALRPAPKKKGVGEFLRHFAGFYGDALTKNPVYAEHLKGRAKADEAQQQNQMRMMAYHYLVNDRQIDPRRAIAMVSNLDKVGEEWSTSERTRDLAPGHTAYSPGQDSYTAPKIVEDGPSHVEIDPNTGSNRTLYRGRSEAEWAAEAAGYQPQTEGWHRFIRDYHLDGQGPTAVQMHQEDNALSRENNIRSTSTSAANNIRSTATSAANSSRPRPPAQPNSEGGIYAEIMRRWTSGGQVNAREREFVKKYELRHGARPSQSRGRQRSGGGSDLIGQVYQRDGRRIQYSKKVGGYVDLATGQRVR